MMIFIYLSYLLFYKCDLCYIQLVIVNINILIIAALNKQFQLPKPVDQSVFRKSHMGFLEGTKKTSNVTFSSNELLEINQLMAKKNNVLLSSHIFQILLPSIPPYLNPLLFSVHAPLLPSLRPCYLHPCCACFNTFLQPTISVSSFPFLPPLLPSSFLPSCRSHRT